MADALEHLESVESIANERNAVVAGGKCELSIQLEETATKFHANLSFYP